MEISQPKQPLTPVHYALASLLILVGLWLRWQGLDTRPLHHDESLHGVYSLYYFADKAKMFYKYDPLLHGPLLYHTIPWSYWLFGVSKWALRVPAALFGSLLIFGPLLLKRWLSPTVIILATAFLSLSPTLVYWSRFIRHDNFVLFSILGMIISLHLSNKAIRPIAFFFFFTLHFCAKENAYVHTMLVLGFLLYEHILYKLVRPLKKSSLSSIFQHFLNYKTSWIIGLLISGFLYSWYYSAGFAYPEGILDGIYRKSLTYWFDQHSTERITGPFAYTFFVNTFYESWWFPFIILHLIFFYRQRLWLQQTGFLASLVIGILGCFLLTQEFPMTFSKEILKIKMPMDFILFVPLVFHAFSSTTTYLLEEKQELGICAYAFFSTLFTYSYLGEKVPWLAAYPLIAGVIFFSIYIERNLTFIAIPFISLFVMLNGYWAYKLNFKEAGQAKHLLSQVHTTPQYEKQAAWLNSQLQKGKFLRAFPGHQWPLTWYLYGGPGYIFYTSNKPLNEYDYILGDFGDSRLSELSSTHRKTVLTFRWWWSPDWKNMTFSKAFNYYWSKEPWNPPYTKEVLFFEKWPMTSQDNLIIKLIDGIHL